MPGRPLPPRHPYNRSVTVRLTFVRHARSEANEAGVWQGQGNSPLSATGREQAAHLGKRLSGIPFDVVVASDLDRTLDTAAATGHPAEPSPEWREMDIGGWEGKTVAEVEKHHPDLLHAIRRGEAVAYGGTGERIDEFEDRIMASVGRLVERVGEGSALVVTHGAVVDTVVGHVLGRIPHRRTFPIPANTSLTTFAVDDGRYRLTSFNDATHLGTGEGPLGMFAARGLPVVAFVRHGVTAANKEGRIQGRTCSGLDDEGREQARRLGAWYGHGDRVVTSPLLRARETADFLVDGRPPEIDPAMTEMAFGAWEGRTFAELRAAGDELARKIYLDGEDLARGGTGETFADLVSRVDGFLAGLEPAAGERTIVVSHGAAIRAVVAAVHGGRVETWRALGPPANTGVTHLGFTPAGPMLIDYSLAPHLERRPG